MSEVVKAETELEKAKKDPKTKVDAAVALLVSGASFGDIARMLDYHTPEHAKVAVERALAATVSLTEREHLRTVMAARYERLLKSVMPRATNPKDSSHLAYNQRANALIDRMVKLHGVEAPTQVVITPSDEYLLAYADQMKQALGLDGQQVEEPNVLEEAFIDVDVEEGDPDA